MLLNSKGQVVNLPKHMNTKDHPHAFAQFREIHEPSEKGHGKMFNLQERARLMAFGGRPEIRASIKKGN